MASPCTKVSSCPREERWWEGVEKGSWSNDLGTKTKERKGVG